MHRHHFHRGRHQEAAATTAEPGERATTRVQLELPPQAMERLQRLKERTEATSYAEVIRNALRLLEAVVGEQEKGVELAFRQPGGDFVAYRLFV
jgi:Ribbon-helix-helix protein, copG family